jgi:hypothetical protein
MLQMLSNLAVNPAMESMVPWGSCTMAFVSHRAVPLDDQVCLGIGVFCTDSRSLLTLVRTPGGHVSQGEAPLSAVLDRRRAQGLHCVYV